MKVIGLIYNKQNCHTVSEIRPATISFCLIPVLAIIILALSIFVHIGFIVSISIPVFILIFTFDSVPDGPIRQTNTTEYVGEIISDGEKAFLKSHKPKILSKSWNSPSRRDENTYSRWTHYDGEYAYYFDLKEIENLSEREIDSDEFYKLFDDTIKDVYDQRANASYHR